MIRRLIVAALLSAAAAQPQEIERTDLGERMPSKEELVELLKLPPPLPSRGGEPAPPPKPRAITSAIGFEIDSAALTEQGKAFLNNLGAALSDEAFMNARILLEGHADATGSEDHNLRLSAARAESVKRFLVDIWGMPDGNISTVGKGETDLLDKANPESAANRAVAIINTGTR
jgi:outer membrane protein OmpA-like peptidoglycan-associated protein